jgi:hypothetical protein
VVVQDCLEQRKTGKQSLVRPSLLRTNEMQVARLPPIYLEKEKNHLINGHQP